MKFFDKLLKINESLDKELKGRGLVVEETKDTIEVPSDSLSDDQKKDILLDKGVDKTAVEKMKDTEEIDTALNTTLNTDEAQAENESVNTDTSLMDWDGPAIIKKEGEDSDSFYIKDDEWSTDIQLAYEFPSKEDAADKIKQLGGDYMFIWPATMKKEGLDESIIESDGEVYLRMDDDDLDMHGYLKSMDGLDKRELEWTDDEKKAEVFVSKADAESAILDICDMFNYDPETFSTQEVDSQVSDNGENWVSLDPTDTTVSTIS